jgi:hypothetical protein
MPRATPRSIGHCLRAINGGRHFAGIADGGIVGRVNGAAQSLANGGAVKAAPGSSASRWTGDINVGVNVMAGDDGRVSRESSRDAGRQVASQVAYHLREMGVI